MELDLEKNGILHKKARPLERSITKLKERNPSSTSNLDKVCTWIEKFKIDGIYNAEYWPLHPHSCFDWRDVSKECGVHIYGAMCLLELDSAQSYRTWFLIKSKAACTLRSAFQEEVRGMCVKKKLKYVDGSSRDTEGTWVYADHMWDEWDEQFEETILSNPDSRRADINFQTELTSDFSKHMRKLQQLQSMMATPESQEIHPDVGDMLDRLDMVWPLLVLYTLLLTI